MNKKLRKLRKALSNLGIDSDWDHFSDDSSEWLEVKIEKGDSRALIFFHPDDEVDIWTEKKEWNEDEQTRVI